MQKSAQELPSKRLSAFKEKLLIPGSVAKNNIPKPFFESRQDQGLDVLLCAKLAVVC